MNPIVHLCFSSKYHVLRTKNEYIDKILTKIEYQIYSCYSNEFHKNTLFARAF